MYGMFAGPQPACKNIGSISCAPVHACFCPGAQTTLQANSPRPDPALRFIRACFRLVVCIKLDLSALQTSQPWFNRRTPVSLDYLGDIAINTFISFFGFFGSQQIALPAAWLVFYGLIIVAGIGGLMKTALYKKHNRQDITPVLMLITAFAGGAAIFALLNYSYYAPLGKYLYKPWLRCFWFSS
jgi:hypothetical protein